MHSRVLISQPLHLAKFSASLHSIFVSQTGYKMTLLSIVVLTHQPGENNPFPFLDPLGFICCEMARRPKVKIQWVARKKARLARGVLLLQRCEDLLRQRIEKLRVEVEKIRIANHEMNIRIILHDLILDYRSVADVPPNVLLDVTSLAEQRLMLLTEGVNFPRGQGAEPRH